MDALTTGDRKPMQKHDQLIENYPGDGQFGDCYRTAIACVLEMPPEEVPHFYNGDHSTLDLDECWIEITGWLNEMGYNIIPVTYDGEYSLDQILSHGARTANGMHWFLSGSSGSSGHVVVCKDNEIIHDPSKKSRSSGGLIGPCNNGFWEVEILVKNIAAA